MTMTVDFLFFSIFLPCMHVWFLGVLAVGWDASAGCPRLGVGGGRGGLFDTNCIFSIYEPFKSKLGVQPSFERGPVT